MADPDKVDDEGNPVAAAEAPVASDPGQEAVIRQQVEKTLRAMAIATLVGLVVIVVIALAVPSIRGVMILVGIVYLLSSLGAQWYLRRKFMSRLKGGASGG